MEMNNKSQSAKEIAENITWTLSGLELLVLKVWIHLKPIMSALCLWPCFQFHPLFEGFKTCILASLLSAKLSSAQSPGLVIDGLSGSQAWIKQAVSHLWDASWRPEPFLFSHSSIQPCHASESPGELSKSAVAQRCRSISICGHKHFLKATQMISICSQGWDPWS